LKNKLLEIVRFCISGVIGVVLGYITLYTLTEWIGLWYLISSMAACLVSYIVGFFIQKFWTFRDKNTAKMKGQIIIYLVISALFFIANTGLMYFFVDLLHVQYIVAQAIVTIILSIISYLTSEKIFAH